MEHGFNSKYDFYLVTDISNKDVCFWVVSGDLVPVEEELQVNLDIIYGKTQ